MVLHRLLWLGLAVIVLPGAVQAQRPQVRWNAPPEEWVWNVPEPVPGMVHGTVNSPSMSREVGYNVLLPAGYRASKLRYPVVYYLHGASGSELSAFELGDLLRKQMAGKKIGDVIWVFPNGGQFSKYRDWDSGNVKAETWVIRELIPHIDRTYRTIDSRDGRALSGWSMGGDAALRFVFKYPEMFCAAATMSAAIDWGAPDDGSDTLAPLSRRNAAALRGRTGLMMVVGENDGLFRSHQRLLPHLDGLKLEYEFQSHPGIGHNLGAIKQKSAESLIQTLARHYAPAKP